MPYKQIGRRMLIAVLLLLVWQAVSMAGVVKPVLLPAPTEVGSALWQMGASGELVKHLGASICRVVAGFFIAAVLGISLGLLMGLSPLCYDLLDAVIQFLRPIPPIAWLPLAVLWFGIEESSKVFIIVIGAFFPIFTNVINGVRQIDHAYIELAKLLVVPRTKLVQKIILPSVLPYMATGLRSGLGYAWMCILAAELTAGIVGIGYLLVDARSLAQTDRVIAGMLVIGAVGKSMDSILLQLEKRLSRWKERYTGE